LGELSLFSEELQGVTSRRIRTSGAQIEAARTRFTAADFVAVMTAEAEDFVFPRGFQDLEAPIHDRLLAGSRLLDPAHAWDREVLARLPAEVREAG
jgi:hypothetical protein